MRSILRPVGLWTSLFASLGLAGTTGCASGGFKLTRSYAQFVNQQNIVIRIVIYLLTSVVFMFTMLADLVLFNTMDFWQGKVAAGDYTFDSGGKTFYVQHQVLPGGGLKQSTVKVFDASKKLLQTVVLHETPAGEIEVLVDETLRTKVRDLANLPMIARYDERGTLVSDQLAMIGMSLFTVAQAPR